jgi:hypothetical protein
MIYFVVRIIVGRPYFLEGHTLKIICFVCFCFYFITSLVTVKLKTRVVPNENLDVIILVVLLITILEIFNLFE